jgi:hypothetical protein
MSTTEPPPEPTPDPVPEPQPAPEPVAALPTLVKVSTAFAARMPSQRMLDMMTKVEGIAFTDLAVNAPFRVVAFRALVRDFPGYDTTALWMHSYDVEVEVADASPLNGKLPTPEPGSVVIGA